MKFIAVLANYFDFASGKVRQNRSILSTTGPTLITEHITTALPETLHKFEVELTDLLTRAAEAGIVISVENVQKFTQGIPNKQNYGMGEYMQEATIRPSYAYVRLMMDELERRRHAKAVLLEIAAKSSAALNKSK